MAPDGQSLWIEVLGPIRALDAHGRDLTPDGRLQRRLLAFFVLRRGHVVSADSAIDLLWPQNPPHDPLAALHNHLSRLRRRLPDGVISSVGEGYRLDAARIALDVDRLVEAVSAGLTADATTVDELGALLERWEGPAYPELGDIDDGRIESARLDELRLRARELQAEQRLAEGTTDGLVAELSALAEIEPLREAPRSLLMAALVATGRRVDALRVYDDFRRRLGEELGIEPSPGLTAQHAEILAGADRAQRTPTQRLPVPMTTLVGRDELVAEVIGLVREHRLVMLVGTGGVGKTRVMVEVGHRLRADLPGRSVVLCELASAGVATAVDVVASALGIDARPGVESVERIVEVVGDSEVVLLLDNCEHVLDPTAHLASRLLAACPRVRIVGTSRERMRVPGEWVCPVPPLRFEGSASPAVELFLQRARAAAPDFDPDPSTACRIEEIVRRLDGLPLAIELAASRLHTHDLTEVAAGLDHRFSLLSSGYRNAPRHASLGAAVAWSFGLLEESLQQIFTDLSVFAGPFTAADAAFVCCVDVPTASDALVELVERSLVVRAPARRFVLLETLRAFGADQLDATGRRDATRDRHARHQVDWVERADRRLLDPRQVVLAEVDDAVPELRSALDWLLESGRVDLAGRLVVGLLDYGFLRLRPDVLAWSEEVTRADPEDRSPVAALVWTVAAYAAWMAGDVAETGVRSARAVRIAEQAGTDLPSEVAAICGSYRLFRGRLDEAVTWYRRGAELARQDRAQRLLLAGTEVLALTYADDPAARARAAALLADVGDEPTPYAAYAWYCAGEAELPVDLERARERLTRAVELAERTNASFVTGLAGASKASIDARVGDPTTVAEDFRRLVTHWRRAGMWSTQWTMLRSVAVLLERLGRHLDAAVLEGAVRATGAGHRIFGADQVALRELGERLRSALGDEAYEEARNQGAVLDGDAAVEHALRCL